MIDYSTATAAEIINDCMRRAGEYASRIKDDSDSLQETEYVIAALSYAIHELTQLRYETDKNT